MRSPAERSTTSQVWIPAGVSGLAADLEVPAGATGVVVFAHGSGSSRRSPRNHFVASELRAAGLATLLMDLLAETEEEWDETTAGSLRFDIPFLAERLEAASRWVGAQRALAGMKLGYFGASTGAAAALVAASHLAASVGAVVSRGGRPDLAGAALERVKAPTLLIVGGLDEVVIDLNREALRRLRCERRMEIVPGATHLFEEPGTLAKSAGLAAGWFLSHLSQP